MCGVAFLTLGVLHLVTASKAWNVKRIFLKVPLQWRIVGATPEPSNYS